MKKYYIIAISLIILIAALLFYIILNLFSLKSDSNSQFTKEKSQYEIYVNSELIGEYDNFSDATREATLHEESYIIDAKSGERIWNKNPKFVVVDENNKSVDFTFFNDAVDFANTNENSNLYHIQTRQIIWDSNPLPTSYKITAPLILQLPELARGCEVTTLAMLLQYANINVDKMELAENIKKDNTPYEIINGKVHFGNPHIGFVGDIYTFDNHGLGVYHEPMYDLLNKYLPNQIIDLTNSDFENILYFISKGYPVAVIINSTYAELTDSQFETWSTDYGDIDVTYREHAVLITGYDENFIYFNDPLNYQNYASKNEFIEAWVQMGSQALSFSSYKN